MESSSSAQDSFRVAVPGTTSDGGGGGGGSNSNTNHPSGNGSGGGGQDDCMFLSPTLGDILSDDRVLRFYQCVKDIKTQRSPIQTGAMFFALCHALGDSVPFLKVPHMSKIMFRQEHQVYAVNIAGTQHDGFPVFSHATAGGGDTMQYDQFKMAIAAAANQSCAAATTTPSSGAAMLQSVNAHHHPNFFAAAAAAAAAGADNPSQQLLQAALASVSSPAPPTAAAAVVDAAQALKRKPHVIPAKDGAKKAKKASPRDKDYSVRRNEIIQDLLKVSEADLFHQANVVDDEVKLIIQGHERNTKFGLLSPLHRFATFANLPAHYDCDFAPKNAGVYFNYEYFQLYLAYRDFEQEKQQQQQQSQHSMTDGSSSSNGNNDSRPVLVQCRSEIEKVLVNTNWEAIRRRLTIGERISQVCGIIGRGFLLLSKQVSGRKLLHNFNTGEWAEFMREFQRPENQALLQTLQTKYSPERFYITRAPSSSSTVNIAAAAPAPVPEAGPSSSSTSTKTEDSSAAAAAAAAAAMAAAVSQPPSNNPSVQN